jgi:hypothetical protein
MSRRVIDERDALRRTVARQDERIRELEAERNHANTAAARYLEELHDTQRGMTAARKERDALRGCLLEVVQTVHGGGRVITVQDSCLEEYEAALGIRRQAEEPTE